MVEGKFDLGMRLHFAPIGLSYGVTGSSTPEGRGWFPSTSYIAPGGNTRVVLSGGLLSSNERSGEVWIGDVQL